MDTYDTILSNLLKTNNTDTKLTIYQSTHPVTSGRTIQEDMIRFKNALKAIRQNDKYDGAMLGETMRSLEALVDDAEFWKRRSRGLAVFADRQGYQTVALNSDIEETQYVKKTFFLSPLVLMQSLGSHYYILDVNLTQPRRLLNDTTKNNATTQLFCLTRRLQYARLWGLRRLKLQVWRGGLRLF